MTSARDARARTYAEQAIESLELSVEMSSSGMEGITKAIAHEFAEGYAESLAGIHKGVTVGVVTAGYSMTVNKRYDLVISLGEELSADDVSAVCAAVVSAYNIGHAAAMERPVRPLLDHPRGRRK